MFCPGCGSQQHGQYCRSCGADLRPALSELEKPEAITVSSSSARDEIGRAVADKIRELKSVKDLSRVVEEVLPEIEAFLETPEEKRLRRIRAGMITSAIGLGVALGFTILGMITIFKVSLFFVACFGLTIFLLGLGFLLNGLYFTIPQKRSTDQAYEPSAQTAKGSSPNLTSKAEQERLFASSVTEHTTHQLSDSQARAREAKLE